MSERAGDGGWFSSAFEQTGPVQDETFIRYGIMAAAREERLIGDATARVIAAQLHSGQISALCSLAATGAIVEGLEAQLRPDNLPVEVGPWIEALEEYIRTWGDRGPIDGWPTLWPTPPTERHD